MIHENKGFTLVELMVVVVILSLLGSIAFLSLGVYTKDARDTVRLTDLGNIKNGIEIKLAKDGKVPFPESYLTIKVEGNIIGYQGDAGKMVLNSIGIHNGGMDPLDNKYYSYFINSYMNKYQVLGLIEDFDSLSFNINKTNASISERIPVVKGDSLGILVDEKNEPIHRIYKNIDINEFEMNSLENSNKKFKAVFTNEENDLKEAGFLGEKIQISTMNK